MKKAQVGRIEIAFHRLNPVARTLIAQRAAAIRPDHRPAQFRQRRRIVSLRPHVRPDDSISLDARVSSDADLFVELAAGRFVGYVHAPALDVELPAVIKTPQAVLLVSSKK